MSNVPLCIGSIIGLCFIDSGSDINRKAFIQASISTEVHTRIKNHKSKPLPSYIFRQ